jgi:hypothetical protein
MNAIVFGTEGQLPMNAGPVGPMLIPSCAGLSNIFSCTSDPANQEITSMVICKDFLSASLERTKKMHLYD